MSKPVDSKHDSSPIVDLSTKEHISKSVYMHSEAMMMLVKELYEHWRMDPEDDVMGNRSYWYYSGLLTTHPQAFVEIMSLELGIDILFDSGREAEICEMILNGLRKKRNAAIFVFQ